MHTPGQAPAPAGHLAIHLLGGFRASVDGRLIAAAAGRRRRARNLVKLLALAPGHRLHREQLGEALWPELDPASAANGLRPALFAARRALDPTAPPHRYL